MKTLIIPIVLLISSLVNAQWNTYPQYIPRPQVAPMPVYNTYIPRQNIYIPPQPQPMLNTFHTAHCQQNGYSFSCIGN